MKTQLIAGGLRALAALGLTGAVLSQAGCVAVAVGAAAAGTVAYVRGQLEASLEGSYTNTVRAADRALADLKFTKVSEKGDALKTTLVARTAADKKIEIDVIKVSDSVTKVQIRVGVFGDEAMSLTILGKIKEHL